MVLSRLEILSMVLQELGYDKKRWDWQPVMTNFVMPAVMHANPEVRLLAMNVVLSFYKIVGNPVRQLVLKTDGLKQSTSLVL